MKINRVILWGTLIHLLIVSLLLFSYMGSPINTLQGDQGIFYSLSNSFLNLMLLPYKLTKGVLPKEIWKDFKTVFFLCNSLFYGLVSYFISLSFRKKDFESEE